MTETVTEAVPTVQWQPATEEQHKILYPEWLGPPLHVIAEIRHGERYPGRVWHHLLRPWFEKCHPHVTAENCDQLLPQGREGSRKVGRLLKVHYSQHGLKPTSHFNWKYTNFDRIRETLHAVNKGFEIEEIDLKNDPRAEMKDHGDNPLIFAGSLDFTMPRNLGAEYYEWEERTLQKATASDIDREAKMRIVSEFLHPVNPAVLRTEKGIPNWALIYEVFQFIRAENNGTHPDPRMGDCEAWAARNLIGSMWGILLDTEGPENVTKWWWTFLVGRHVHLIKELVTKKVDTENGVEMTLIICHDSSILALLLALGVVDPADPRIPGFHTTLVIEVFVITVPDTQKPEDTEDAKYVKKRFIRFLLNNQPLKLGEDFQEWDPSGLGAGLHLYAQKDFFNTERLNFAANQTKWRNIQTAWKTKISVRAVTPEPKSEDAAAGSRLASPPKKHGDTLKPSLSARQEAETSEMSIDQFVTQARNLKFEG